MSYHSLTLWLPNGDEQNLITAPVSISWIPISLPKGWNLMTWYLLRIVYKVCVCVCTQSHIRLCAECGGCLRFCLSLSLSLSFFSLSHALSLPFSKIKEKRKVRPEYLWGFRAWARWCQIWSFKGGELAKSGQFMTIGLDQMAEDQMALVEKAKWGSHRTW